MTALTRRLRVAHDLPMRDEYGAFVRKLVTAAPEVEESAV
jgi:hypothetical protein